jgi:SNF family Na+-dependent transporter
VVGDFLLILGGFFTALLVGWKILPQVDAELAKGMPNPALRRGWALSMRYLVPVILFFVLWHAAGPAWKAFRGLVTFAG